MLPNKIAITLIYPLTLLMWMSNGAAQPPDPVTDAPSVELNRENSSPEQTIRGFVAALEEGHFSSLWQFVLGARSEHRLPGEYEGYGAFIRIELNEVEEIFKEQNQACVSVNLQLKGRVDDGKRRPTSFQSPVLLERRQNVWKIIPAAGKAAGLISENPVLVFATLLGQPEAFESMAQEGKLKTAVSNVKQLSSALQQLLRDNNNTFTLDAGDYTKSLKHYIVNDILYFLPGVEPQQKFAFNSNLSGLKFNDLKDPHKIVMLYTGKSGQLELPFQDLGIVAFADGSVKVLERKDIRDLTWKP